MLRGAASLAAAGCLGSSSLADNKSHARLIDSKTRQAIDRGLQLLANRQNDDGSMGRTAYRENVAVASLAGMAWMASGNMPGRGRFGQRVNRTIEFVLNHTQPSGFITSASGASHGPMYGHGFATLFLAEAYGMSPNRDIRERLSAAVKLIVSTQNKEGGWRYYPQRNDADISVNDLPGHGAPSRSQRGDFRPQ